MKTKVSLIALSVLGLAATACVDSNYDTGKYNPENDVTVEIQPQTAKTSAAQFVGSFENAEIATANGGKLIAKTPEKDKPTLSLSQSTPVSITVPVPVSDKIADPRSYQAFDSFYTLFELTTNYEGEFTLSGKVGGIAFEKQVPAAKKSGSRSLNFYVSDKKPIESEDDENFFVEVSEYRNAFASVTKESAGVQFTDFEVKPVSVKSGLRSYAITCSCKAENVFPLNIVANKPLIIYYDEVLDEPVDIREYKTKKVKLSYSIEHNFPFEVTAELYEPAGASVDFPKILSANYPESRKDDYVMSLYFNDTLEYVSKLSLKLTMLYTGAGTASFQEDMSFDATLNKVTVTTEL